MPKILTHRKSCRFCNRRTINPVLRFVQTPLKVFAETLPDEETREARQPLILSVCENCKLIQLLDVTDPELLHRDSSHVVGITDATRKHFEEYAEYAIRHAHLKEDDLVVDIGSGNGALAEAFTNRGMRVVSVDPSIQEEPSEGLPQHYSDFFSPALAGRIMNDHGKAALITANYVMGSVDNVHAFVAGVRHLLKPEGIFIAEEPYLADIMEQTMFDAINPKRLSFITAGPYELFLKSTQMHLIAAERSTFRRGTVRFMAQRSDGPHVASPKLTSFIEEERDSALFSVENLANFASRVEELKNAFRKTVSDLKATGNTVAGYGATGRSMTFILECGWHKGVLEFIVDPRAVAAGKYLAGTEIPILGTDALAERKPSHVIIFAYHDAEHIMAQHRDYAAQGGKFIVPFPGLKIV